MKRYQIEAKPWDVYSVTESDTGDWVRFEDADAKLAMAEALLAQARAAAQAANAELDALRARVTRVIGLLATPGTWSEFARVALKELRGG